MTAVYLRALDEGDLERTWRWHNDAALYATLVGPFRHVSMATERQWLARQAMPGSDRLSLAICVREGDQHVGNLYLHEIDWIARHARLGLFIGESDYRGRGVGMAAMDQAIAHARDDMGLHRLWLTVLPDNLPAIHLYEKCGFTVEGRLREHVFKQGRWHDLVAMGLGLMK